MFILPLLEYLITMTSHFILVYTMRIHDDKFARSSSLPACISFYLSSKACKAYRVFCPLFRLFIPFHGCYFTVAFPLFDGSSKGQTIMEYSPSSSSSLLHNWSFPHSILSNQRTTKKLNRVNTNEDCDYSSGSREFVPGKTYL